MMRSGLVGTIDAARAALFAATTVATAAAGAHRRRLGPRIVAARDTLYCLVAFPGLRHSKQMNDV